MSIYLQKEECFRANVIVDALGKLVVLTIGDFGKHLKEEDVIDDLMEAWDYGNEPPFKKASQLTTYPKNLTDLTSGIVYQIKVSYTQVCDGYSIFLVQEILENKNISEQLRLD